LADAGPAGGPGTLQGALGTAARFGHKLLTKAEHDDVLFMAGGVAFNILLAGLPFFLLLVAGIGLVVGTSDTASSASVARVIRDLFPDSTPGSGSIFDPLVRDIVDTSGKATVVGALALLLFSMRLFGSLRGVLNRAFAVPKGRHIVIGKLHDLGLTVAATVLFTMWVGLSAYVVLARTRGVELLARMGLHQEAIMGPVTYVSGRLLTFALLLGIFFALYTVIPNRKVSRGQAFFGALVGAALFEVARLIFTWVLLRWNPATIYSGTIAAIVIVVFWVYYAALIMIVGGMASQIREEMRAA
jgi:membrane protein